MKNYSTVFLTVITLAAAALLLLPGCSGSNVPPFYRADSEQFVQDTQNFRVDHSLRRIYFKKGKEEVHLDKLPSIDASFFFLKGKKQIKIKPPAEMTGKGIRFYSYLHLDSLDQNRRIDFSLAIHRDGRTFPVEQMSVSKESRDFFTRLDVKKGDWLLLRFQGRGIVCFSRPIIYRAADFRTKEQKSHNYIILIGVDTLRGDMVGKKINGRSLTPNMDAFIKDSVSLEQAYAQTSWTLVSFMSMFTGLYEYRHDVGIKNPLTPDKPFLVEPLAQEYITFAYHGGKVMNGRWGFSRGFDYYKKYQPAGALFKNGGQSLFRKGIELIKNSRFPNLFLFLHTYQVHAPYWPPEQFIYAVNPKPAHTRLDAVNFSEPEKTFLPVAEPLKNSLKELYQAEVLAFDTYFGDFMAQLKELNIYENAMIVLVSDHGEEFFEHKGWAHSHALYDEQILVPLIVKFPGSRLSGTRIATPVGLLDLMPTILDFYKIGYNAAELDGMSLMPLFENPKSADFHRGPVVSSISTGRYFDAIPPKIALRFDRYKLIYNTPFSGKDLEFFKDYTAPPPAPKFELYDLIRDPGETRNIAGTQPRIKDKMMPLLLDIRKLILEKLSTKDKKKKLDKEVQEQLKSLGYL